MSTKYTAFTREQIEAALPIPQIGDKWLQGLAGNEITFGHGIGHGWFIRCYSALSKTNDQSRAAGADAIRFVLLDAVSGKPRDKGIRVHRTGTVESLRERFAERVAKLVETAKAEQPLRCKRCGAMTAERKNKSNGRTFRGCVRWKECQLHDATGQLIKDSLDDSPRPADVPNINKGANDDGSRNRASDGRVANGSNQTDRSDQTVQRIRQDRGGDSEAAPDDHRSELQVAGNPGQSTGAVQHGEQARRHAGLAAALASTYKKHPPTVEQQAIIDAARSGVKVLIVQAGAGAGKTATDVMIAEAMPGKRGQYTTFVRALVDDARGKFPASCAVKGVHQLAFRAEGKRFQHRLNSQRVKSEDVAKMLGISAITVSGKRLAPGFLAGLVLKAVRRFCNSADTEPGVEHFSYQDGIDMPGPDGKRTWDNNNALRAELLPFTRKAWADLSDPNGRLPYNADCYVKLWELNHPVIDCDYLLADEVQDLSPVMLSIFRKQEHCQLIMVGDSAQQIFEWRGAVDALKSFPDAPTFYLSQSFRFGPAIAAVANAVLETLDEPTALRLKGLESIRSSVISACTSGEPDGRRVAPNGTDSGHFANQPKATIQIRRGNNDGRPDQAVEGRCGETRSVVAGDGRTDDEGAATDSGQLHGTGAKDGGVEGGNQLATILCRTNACAVANLLGAMTESRPCEMCGGSGRIKGVSTGTFAPSAFAPGGVVNNPCGRCKGTGHTNKRPFLVGGGADVIKFVEAAQSLKEGRGTSHPELACFGSWGEVEEYAKLDEGEDLRLMCKLIKEFGCRAILDALRRMPEERDADLIISTAHKSKGREWDHVRLAADFPTKSKCGDPERKLLYVAVTRAKLTLDVSGCPFFTGQDSLDVSNLKGANDAQNNDQPGDSQVEPTQKENGRPSAVVVSESCQAAENTWSKRDGKWLIRGAKGQSGVVTVTRKNGQQSRERLGKVVEETGYTALYEVENR